MDRNVERFVEHLKQKTADYGVSLVLPDTTHVRYNNDDVMCNGYFVDKPNVVLACAVGKDVSLWLPILVHESCHMDQWIEQAPQWVNGIMPDGREAIDTVVEWIHGTDHPMELVADCLGRSREVELDCEMRTAKKIRQFDLPINVEEYIQRSNSYILFYNFMKTSRKWYTPGKEPYNTPDVWKNAPTDFTGDYSQLSPKLEAAFRTIVDYA